MKTFSHAVPAFWGVLLVMAQAHAAPIDEIRIRNAGDGATDPGFVRSHIQLRQGQELDPASLSHDLRSLLATGRFSDVKVESETVDGKLVVTFVIKSKLRLAAPVKVVGAQYMSEGEIKDLLGLEPGDLVDDAGLAVKAQKVAAKYREYRYFDVKTEWALEVVDGKTGAAAATLRITEGARMQVGGLAFTGNRVVSSRSLRRTTGDVPPWWDPFRWFTSHAYDEDQLEADREAVRHVFMARGYLDVEVSDPQFVKDQSGRYVVAFAIKEGILYRVGEMSVKGVKLFPEAELVKLATIRRGDPASTEEVKNTAERIRLYYTSRGYLRTMVKHALSEKGQRAQGAETVDIVFTVAEGSLVNVRNIHVRGNTATREHVIRRELTIYPGEVMSEPQVKKSEARLKNLGFFSTVTTHTEPTARAEESDLVFEVEDQRTGTLLFGGGFSSIDKLVGFMEISEGNFDIGTWPPKGAGQKMRFREQIGSVSRATELSFVEPWFLGRRLSLGVDLYDTKTDYDEYDLERMGAGINIGKAVNAIIFNRVDFKYEIEKIDVSGGDTNRYYTVENDPYYYTYTNQLKSMVSLSLTREARDNTFFPTRGNRVVLTGFISGGALGGDSEVYGWRAKAEQHFPLWLGHVITMRARAEVVDEYGDQPMQIFDRLFIGGGRTIRGFQYRAVGPKVYDSADSHSWGGCHSIGGKTLAFGSVEYVLPLYEKLKIALFFDAGNVWRDAYDFDFEHMASSAGIELRLDFPQFPIRINYGQVIRKDEDVTRKQPWGFWIGSGF